MASWVINYYKQGSNSVHKSYKFMHEEDAHACMDWDDFKYVSYANGVFTYQKGDIIALLGEV